MEKDIISPIGEDNGKTIKLKIELCRSWGFTRKVEKIYSLLIRGLAEKGYTVDYEIEGTFYGEGEYYIYLGEKKIPVFLNKNKKAEEEKCIYGNGINKDNVDEVIEFIEKKLE
jgi:hypothetical protein